MRDGVHLPGNQGGGSRLERNARSVTRVALGNGTLAEMSWRGVRTASCFVGGNGTHVSRAAPYNTNIINTLQQSILSRGRSAFAVYPLSYLCTTIYGAGVYGNEHPQVYCHITDTN